MSEALREANVYVQDILAGRLQETDTGYSFIYDMDYVSSSAALPVSLTLPLSQEIYMQPTLFSFFDGLIPEGWLLDVASRNWKIDPSDRFGLLLVTCRDCIGDVRVERREME